MELFVFVQLATKNQELKQWNCNKKLRASSCKILKSCKTQQKISVPKFLKRSHFRVPFSLTAKCPNDGRQKVTQDRFRPSKPHQRVINAQQHKNAKLQQKTMMEDPPPVLLKKQRTTNDDAIFLHRVQHHRLNRTPPIAPTKRTKKKRRWRSSKSLVELNIQNPLHSLPPQQIKLSWQVGRFLTNHWLIMIL